MKNNCDNCGNYDKHKMMQDCKTFGYPLFNPCENWIAIFNQTEKDEKQPSIKKE